MESLNVLRTRRALVIVGNDHLADMASAQDFDAGSDPLAFALRSLQDNVSADVTWTVAVGGPFGAVVVDATLD